MLRYPLERHFHCQPGYACVPGEPTYLCAVAAAGVSVTLYDPRRRLGGMTHYARPYRRRDIPSTPFFACPAIVGLVRMFTDSGSLLHDLEAGIYGGVENPRAWGYEPGLAHRNVEVGLELIQRYAISLAVKDVGGRQGRKIVFHSGTGEALVAHVDHLRPEDWYPRIQHA